MPVFHVWMIYRWPGAVGRRQEYTASIMCTIVLGFIMLAGQTEISDAWTQAPKTSKILWVPYNESAMLKKATKQSNTTIAKIWKWQSKRGRETKPTMSGMHRPPSCEWIARRYLYTLAGTSCLPRLRERFPVSKPHSYEQRRLNTTQVQQHAFLNAITLVMHTTGQEITKESVARILGNSRSNRAYY